jgi:hypothetical protein
MLNFLKAFKQTDTNKYTAQIRNTVVQFKLLNATSMDDNYFHISNKSIVGSMYGVDWKTVEEVINITDPVK